ncbi:MAG: hypothetical protein IPK10_18400 [Bacteroidetes bacterium]|nr:hypothetical protein [Bacteroidota bacterium]
MKSLKSILNIGLLFLAMHSLCLGQKHDNRWMLGYISGPNFSQPALDFYFGYPDTIGFYGYFLFYNANVSMSNAQGALQFYTNGTEVANKLHSPLAGSLNYNAGVINANNQPLQMDQSVIGIPDPGSSSNYYLFHVSGGPYISSYQPVQLKMSKIDMSLQGGLGQMVSTVNALSTPLLYRTLHAVKHGNGRDWWIVIGGYNSGQFFSLLLTPNGIDTTVISNTPVVFPFGLIRGQCSFSADGSTFALTSGDLNQVSATNQVVVYNFDRCNGNFSHRETFYFPSTIDSTLYGCQISPSGRYLYVNTGVNLYQYDLSAPVISTTKAHIAIYNNFQIPNSIPFYLMQLGPDNKIYMGSVGGSKYISVINYPDSAGVSCNFVQQQLQLVANYTGTFPHFPNYRLGPATGSLCDTLTVGIATNTIGVQKSYYSNGNIVIELIGNFNQNLSYRLYSSSGQLVQKGMMQCERGSPCLIPVDASTNSGIYIFQIDDTKLYSRSKVAIIKN